MDKDRILKEAQGIAARFSFWMVSGNIAHLYGHVLETPEAKYELEIKFNDHFPIKPPLFIYSAPIKDLLGDLELERIKYWKKDSTVVDCVLELKDKVENALNIKEVAPQIVEELTPINPATPSIGSSQTAETEEYITPDFNAYPSDDIPQVYLTPTSSDDAYYQESYEAPQNTSENSDKYQSSPEFEVSSITLDELENASIAAAEELSLIQQYYAYDQRGTNQADINIYLTVTMSNTFVIGINFANYPEKPEIHFPDEIRSLLGDLYQSLDSLRKWNQKKALHIVDILHELETKLYFMNDIELEIKKVQGEYQCEVIPGNPTQLKVHLLTYGFNEFLLDIDIGKYPKPPEITLSSQLQNLIQTQIDTLDSYKNWKEKKSESVEVLREISWLLDKNSRIKFEIELLQANYKDIKYDSAASTIRIDMKGKMKTQDLTFEFQINLPKDYPTQVPEIKVLNEFDIDIHEKIKTDLQASFKNFFDEWTPFKYLVDLFNTISEKIFEVSVVSCVICHKIDCPTCSVKIAGQESCHVECPYCERAYHKHCWEQTIKSFGKCGFCLKTPPPSMMP